MMKHITKFLLLLLLCSCANNKIFHRYDTAQPIGKAVRTLSVSGEGVLADQLRAAVIQYAPQLTVLNQSADLSLQLSSLHGEFLTVSCYQNSRLLFSRSCIWTSHSDKANLAFFKQTVTALSNTLSQGADPK